MGFNTVAFLLNDFIHELERSPKTVAWALAHPPTSGERIEVWQSLLADVAKTNGEPALHHQALEILPSFHADSTHFFRAGSNCIVPLKVLRYGRKDGKRTVTLELPSWDKG